MLKIADVPASVIEEAGTSKYWRIDIDQKSMKDEKLNPLYKKGYKPTPRFAIRTWFTAVAPQFIDGK